MEIRENEVVVHSYVSAYMMMPGNRSSVDFAVTMLFVVWRIKVIG